MELQRESCHYPTACPTRVVLKSTLPSNLAQHGVFSAKSMRHLKHKAHKTASRQHGHDLQTAPIPNNTINTPGCRYVSSAPHTRANSRNKGFHTTKQETVAGSMCMNPLWANPRGMLVYEDKGTKSSPPWQSPQTAGWRGFRV